MDDNELLLKMRNFEDHFVERKTASDDKDWLKTIVAFANSTPPNSTSVLFIGVRNDGEIQTPQVNLDSMQMSLNRELKKAFPPIACVEKVVSENGRQALAVLVQHSNKRPHFSGPPFIRQGSQTFVGTEEQVNELRTSQSSKVKRILAYKGKPVYVVNVPRNLRGTETYWTGNPHVDDCNEDFITIQNGPSETERITFPMEDVSIGFDYQRNQFKISILR